MRFLFLRLAAPIAAIATTTYFIGYRHGRRESTPATSQSYLTDMYTLTLTPAEFTEWAQLQSFKGRQIAQAYGRWMVKR